VGSELTSAVRALAMGGRVLERALADASDMTLPQFRVLMLIASSPERASRLAEKAAVSRPSLTGLLDGLEAKGWVERATVEGDRRGVRLELTRSGAAALKQAERAMVAELDSVLRDASDARDVIQGLNALGHAMRERAHARR
jgi:DNA-binding MarR family transcriptional regulator